MCAPFLDRADRLPTPQREAVATAFELSAGPPPYRVSVLLESVLPGRLDDQVSGRVMAEARGNPLELRELSCRLDPGLAAVLTVESPLTVAMRIDDGFEPAEIPGAAFQTRRGARGA